MRITTGDRVFFICQVFCITKVQLCYVLGITRGEMQRSIKENDTRDKYYAEYRRLYLLAWNVSRKLNYKTLKGGSRSILIDGDNLIKHLKNRSMNEKYIITVCQKIRRILDQTETSSRFHTKDEQMRAAIYNTKVGL